MNKKKQEKIKKSTTSWNYERPYGVYSNILFGFFSIRRVLSYNTRERNTGLMGKEVSQLSLHLMATEQVPAQRRQIAKLFFSLRNWDSSPAGECAVRVHPPLVLGGGGGESPNSDAGTYPVGYSIYYLCPYYLYGLVHHVLDAGRSITRESGRGLGPRIREFFGPSEMASSR
jgi:hypothetical protein